jgi:hypothetical protein
MQDGWKKQKKGCHLLELLEHRLYRELRKEGQGWEKGFVRAALGATNSRESRARHYRRGGLLDRGWQGRID